MMHSLLLLSLLFWLFSSQILGHNQTASKTCLHGLHHTCTGPQCSKVTEELHPCDYCIDNLCNGITASAVPNGKEEVVIPNASISTVAATRPTKPYSRPEMQRRSRGRRKARTVTWLIPTVISIIILIFIALYLFQVYRNRQRVASGDDGASQSVSVLQNQKKKDSWYTSCGKTLPAPT
ncbi:hypothetical protein VTN77DRAFT_3142 [Rasamsonia byssochlamydoides]|uniref:uncharacterized protein n=1 Tax=Rasamsonia byssochlamydoides TaxID=89139 RepID=UPI0037444A46